SPRCSSSRPSTSSCRRSSPGSTAGSTTCPTRWSESRRSKRRSTGSAKRWGSTTSTSSAVTSTMRSPDASTATSRPPKYSTSSATSTPGSTRRRPSSYASASTYTAWACASRRSARRCPSPPPAGRRAPTRGRGPVRPGDGGAGVGVCTLTDSGLADRLSGLPGVVVAAPLRTANIGIEQIVHAVLARPSLRALLVCGADSRLFRPGQSLIALLRHGLDGDGGRICRAEGYEARLPGLSVQQVERFRNQLVWHDSRGVDNAWEPAAEVAALHAAIRRNPAPPASPVPESVRTAEPTELRPRGRRRDLSTALQGF